MSSRRISKTTTVNRRDFLKGSALVTGAAIVWPTIVPSSVFGTDAPSNRITMGCIGTGGQGSSNMKGFNAKSGCQVVAVCDVDAGHRESARKTVDLDPKFCYNDFRELLARNDIDAVSIATPDH